MARAKKKKAKRGNGAVGRGLWKGTIAFGLVNIPVQLVSAQQADKIHFRMVDKRDHAPVGYRTINKVTGKEISRQEIVKAFEYKKGRYVVMSDADLKKANVKATNTIEIEDFVDLEEVDFLLFERPYYVVPQRGGAKGYVLLRDVLQRTHKAAIAKIVLHTVQHLAAIIARGDYLILELLRFADEVKEVEEADILDPTVLETKPSEREVKVATQLVEGMSGPWDPEKYRNTYREDIMKMVNAKVKRGTTMEIEEVPPEEVAEVPTNVVDMTALLKKSLAAAKRPRHRRSESRGT